MRSTRRRPVQLARALAPSTDGAAASSIARPPLSPDAIIFGRPGPGPPKPKVSPDRAVRQALGCYPATFGRLPYTHSAYSATMSTAMMVSDQNG